MEIETGYFMGMGQAEREVVEIPDPTHEEMNKGYQVCPCDKFVHILQAGFES